MGCLRYLASSPRQANEYFWAQSTETARRLAVAHFKPNSDIKVQLTYRYEFAFKIGIASARTKGNTLEECKNNLLVHGFTGDHDIELALEQELVKQDALILIRIADDIEKYNKLLKYLCL